jgi:chromosome segregation ATPase
LFGIHGQEWHDRRLFSGSERARVIEQAMIFALGFMIAGLVALAIAPAFWSRAIRLSTNRLQMLLPLSVEEIRADRDLLRAEFAVERRRLEQKAEALNRVHGEDLGELGRRAAIIVGREAEIATLQAKLSEAGAEIAALGRSLAEATGEYAATSTALNGASILVERKDAELIALRSELARESASLSDLRTLFALEQAKAAAQAEEIARRVDDAEAIRINSAAQIAEYEAALDAARRRENELQRKRKRGIGALRAIQRKMKEQVEALRLTAAETAQAGFLDQASEKEENAILRQTVNEIGAAIIRMAATGIASGVAEETAIKTERDEIPARLPNLLLAKPEATLAQEDAPQPKISPARRS